ncbi:MAG: alpha/beta hydrolase [Dietzia sp.]|uniref:alpha/beta fold hydrolase n=1 Tax=Dietzia TaxID=37914 RepID=UPI0015CE2C62|nr:MULTISPECIES: alpha/beta hydrolase [Dietzia]MBB1032883.1 alpha/beta hydrolase [Dietzia sp. CQ4]MBB1053842.1 alpha/beta hydrolase [Dietzia sp. B44]MBC7294783.1 alpha/beta hydrolase [Dietzia sp.]MCT1515546.1 alpha/beta hydrolase [Dietzia cercidiphylli]MDO8394577.1 alpha/beta hydrolase [Dietzia sp.]
MEPQSMTVDIPAGTLDVLDWRTTGPERGTVLALHGFPESPWEWEAVAGVLTQQGLRVVAPAQRGYSAGARPDDVGAYAIEHLSADALAIVDHLGLETVHVLGHDWGASVAWWLAAHHPGRVSSLTVVSVPHLSAFAWALQSDPDQQARSAYFALFRQEGKAEDVLLEDGARRLRAMFDEHVSDELIAKHLEVVGTRAGLTGALNWYRAMRRYDLPDVSVPTTYLWGEDDPAIGRSGAEATASRMAGEYRFVPLAGMGHWLPEQAPEVVAAEVLDRIG